MATITQSITSASSSSGTSSSTGYLTLQSAQSAPFDPEKGDFAFAQLYGDICLVQLLSFPIGSMESIFIAPVKVGVFRHEFGTMFRYVHQTTAHANDFHVLRTIDRQHVLCEDTGVIFVAREMTDQLLKWKAPRRISMSCRPQRLLRR